MLSNRLSLLAPVQAATHGLMLPASAPRLSIVTGLRATPGRSVHTRFYGCGTKRPDYTRAAVGRCMWVRRNAAPHQAKGG